MKIRKCLLLVTALLSLNTMAEEKKENEIDLNVKTKDAIEFAAYIDTRPENILLFETTTREIYHDKKEAFITEVGKMKPEVPFDGVNYGDLKNPFILDYSKIDVSEEINEKTYPQERIEDNCNLTVIDYGLFVEGNFVGDKFIATNLKRKELSRITNRYCYVEQEQTFQEITE